MNEPRYTLIECPPAGAYLYDKGEMRAIIPGLDKARALVATLNAAEQMREALEDAYDWICELLPAEATGGDRLDKLRALLAAKGVQP